MMLNPIIEKDIKTKMRGWRTPALLSVYLLFLTGVLYLFFLVNDMVFGRYGTASFTPRVAVNAYNVIAWFQFGLLMLIVPALTSTAISGERERQTLDLLLCSDISPWSIVVGKVVVSIAHIMFLVVASLPVLGMVFMFGGISFGEILLLFLFYVLTALMAASLGVFLSTVFKRNVTAIITTYICLGILAVGPLIALFIWALFYESRSSAPLTYSMISAILFPSPFFGFTSFMTGGRASDLGILFTDLQNLAAADTGFIRHFKPWMINGFFDIVFSGIMIWLSAIKLVPVKRVKQKRRKKA